MKSSVSRKNTSHVEVQDISKNGIWIFVNEQEYFLPYKEYPWFKDAKVSEIQNIRISHGSHLHWPDLDVDLELEILQHPEKYPLIYH
ncbi:MAG: DUF2442 domain-containing protein [Thermoguttaceae bacterium]|jgi:hypothetical protein